VHVATLQAKPRSSPNRTGCEEPHSAKVVEAIKGMSHGIIVQGVGRDGLAQEQFRVLRGKEFFQAVQRTTATEVSNTSASTAVPASTSISVGT
jgi:hypothetical protein